ncbi:MAG: Cys-tRNA(Pro) deacylase [Ignavibacteria bacterium]|nr:Cys-tRNA(Pro) deacylase [Ignavibacteria bacterium]
MTPAIKFLADKGIKFEIFTYKYKPKGGAKQTSEELGVPLHSVIKTLVFCSPQTEPFLVLMHGDLEVNEKGLARQIGVKSVFPCEQRIAQNWTGYLFGGTSPFGTKRMMKVYIEKSIFDLSEIFINGGRQGLILKLDVETLKILNFEIVEVSKMEK